MKGLEVLCLLWTEKESRPGHHARDGNAARLRETGGKRRPAPLYTGEDIYMIRLPLQNRGQSRSSLSAVLPLSWSSRRACLADMVYDNEVVPTMRDMETPRD